MISADQLRELVTSTVQHLAMQIAVMPAEDRKQAYLHARISLENAIEGIGIDPHAPSSVILIDTMCEGIRTTVEQMPAHGRA